jgi:hypothetical protein
MEGVIQVDEPIAFRCRRGELQARLNRLGAGIREGDGVEPGVRASGALGQALGEKAGDKRTVHLARVRSIEVKEIMEGLLQDRVTPSEMIDAAAGEEVEIRFPSTS